MKDNYKRLLQPENFITTFSPVLYPFEACIATTLYLGKFPEMSSNYHIQGISSRQLPQNVTSRVGIQKHSVMPQYQYQHRLSILCASSKFELANRQYVSLI